MYLLIYACPINTSFSSSTKKYFVLSFQNLHFNHNQKRIILNVQPFNCSASGHHKPSATNICSNTYERFGGFLEVDNTYDGGGVRHVGRYPTILLWRLLVVGRLQLYPTNHVVRLQQLLVTTITINIIIIIVILIINIITCLVGWFCYFGG